MKIAMFTNTYLPHMGGVANSVDRFARSLRERGHEVLIVAPRYRDGPEADEEENVLRLPALQDFKGSDFAVPLPGSHAILKRLREFQPDLIHSHHPFLVGDVALRLAGALDLPLVFTHHTMYEHYTHYLSDSMEIMVDFILELDRGYANLCDLVIAPSESVSAILRERGVETRIEVIPTGVDTDAFDDPDDPAAFRRAQRIPDGAFVAGHVGRLAVEKNLRFLADAVSRFCRERAEAHFLVVGNGPETPTLRRTFKRRNLADRIHFAGPRRGRELVTAYHAMDVFAFASKSETQGMVLAEACACGTPVVALDAPGAREATRDRQTGRLVREEDARAFARALCWMADRDAEARETLRRNARALAASYDTSACVDRLEETYRTLPAGSGRARSADESEWDRFLRSLENNWEIWTHRLTAFVEALSSTNGH